MNFKDLADTDFFSFFHIHEIESKSGPNGTVIKIMKPGGFKEFIDIDFTLLDDGTIIEARLRLDKGWIGNKNHLNPFANDIAKSYIYLFGNGEKYNEIKVLSDYIYHLKGIDDEVIYVQGHEPSLSTLPENIEGAINVYLGNREIWELDLGEIKLEMRQISENKPKVMVRFGLPTN